MYPQRGGQDHLGLGSVVTDRILPRLSPGINVLTIHPRYWSFYAFVLSEFWKRDLPRTRAALRAWFRPLECIYSVACSLCNGPNHRGAPIGTRRLSPVVAAKPTGFDPQFHYMDSAMGGYGLYYATVMQTVGLVAPADRRLGVPVDTVTPEGQVVACAFRSVVADTEYYQSWIGRHDEAVPYEVVEEYGQHACFCRLRDPEATDRSILADAFLHLGNEEEARARRMTLRFMCELAAQSAGASIDEPSFRRLIYFGADYGNEDRPAPTFIPTDAVLSTARRWRLYQMREYFNASVNEMWRRLCYWGLKKDGHLIQSAEVSASLHSIDFMSFSADLGVDLPEAGLSAVSSYRELLDWVIEAGAVSGELDDRWDLNADLTEDRIIGWLNYGRGSTASGADRLAAAMTLITFVAARLWRDELALVSPADWFPVVHGGHERLGIQRFLSRLRDRETNGATVWDVAEWLTFDYVISQHERVAMAKLPTTGDTFRFRREANRLRFFPKGAQVGMNNSRFNALATFLFELGWSGYLYDEYHDLTPEGQQLRLDGDLSPTGKFDLEGV
ncbi:MAG: hypothetical protein OXI33_02285 [Chloroflexota bacterium]|nr:hypothetical protein [Chloroflexota bacterium]